jgi:glycosyltransferase involved in cell wall biosynthesis
MPSVCFDAFEGVNMEVMASQKPVISTCYGGSPEVVEDGVTGYIIDPRDTNRIAEKAIDLHKNPQKAEQLGRTGYARVKKNFNLEDKIKAYIMMYTLLLEKKKV